MNIIMDLLLQTLPDSEIIAREASFLVSSMARIFSLSLSIYIFLFQAVRRAVNVLNVSMCI